MQRGERDIDIGAARAGKRTAVGTSWRVEQVGVVQVHAEVWCWGTIATRKQRQAGGVPRDGRLAAHVVVVVALRRRRRHEGRRRRQARGPAPGAARERVHGGERAHVAHARGALAAERLRPAARSLLLPPAPGSARALRSPPALRVCRPPAHALLRFVLNF